MLVNDEVIKTPVQKGIGSITEVPILCSWQDEAGRRFVSHIDWSVNRGCKMVVVVSNDISNAMGLQKALVEFGTGEYKQKIPLLTLHATFGAAFCHILVNVHVLSGNDAVSKVGTKHAALTCLLLTLLKLTH